MPQPNGQLQQSDYFDNTGGLNLADSAFRVKDTQSTATSINFNYTQTGGIKKRNGHSLITSSPDAQLRSLLLSLYTTSAGVKTVLRAAGTKIQTFDVDVVSSVNLTEDTATAGSDFLASSSTQPVVGSQYNSPSNNIQWMAGGGMSSIYGVYSTTKVTQNGASAPTGSVTPSVNTHNSGAWAAAGLYRYAFALRKASTQALSNVALDTSATVVNTDDTVTLPFTSLGAIDTTKYDKIYVYRSALNGAALFTTGSLVAQVNTSATSYVDTGSSLLDAQNIPRADSLVLDNSVLPTATFTVLTSFKRRLVTAKNSTLYFSDINKPESWPTVNTITIPSGGPITALGIVSFSTDFSNDEYLAVFKERELWIIQGNSISDYVLSFVDAVGCPSQPLIVTANGFMSWIDYRGIYLWNGSGKPIYASRPIEPMFQFDGDLDKSKLNTGVGQYFRKQNEIIWFLSSKSYGNQKFQIKLDLRLTLPSIQMTLDGRIMDGIFAFDNTAFSITAALSYIPSGFTDESLLLGDDSGNVYNAYIVSSDAGVAFSLNYTSKFLDMGNPNIRKRYHKVIAWVEEVGDWNLILDYWTGYNVDSALAATSDEPISTAPASGIGLWDVGSWDVAYWDSYTKKLKPIVFNLRPNSFNNCEGESLRLRFRQDGLNQPVTIAGFSVVYSTTGAT